MSQRFDLAETCSEGYQAMLWLHETVVRVGLDLTLQMFVKTHVSQISGCVFCVAMQLDVTRNSGVSEGRNHFLPVWREVPVYSAEKRVHPLQRSSYGIPKKFLPRNSVIALEYLRDSAYVPDLASALNDPNSLVRGYSAWALGQSGREKVRGTLERHVSSQTRGRVKPRSRSLLMSRGERERSPAPPFCEQPRRNAGAE